MPHYITKTRMLQEEELSKIYSHINTIVKSATKEAIEQVLKTKNSQAFNPGDESLSAEQAADFLKIKLNTVYAKVDKFELPHYYSGKRKLLFSKNELVEYVIKRKGKNNTEISEEVDDYILNKPRIKK